MKLLQQSSIVVYDFAGLSAALGTGNDYGIVYLGADIVMTGGITIDPNKASLILDGTWNEMTHTLTEPQSNNSSASLGIRDSSDIQITLRNIHLEGRNFYGMPYIADAVPPFLETSDVVVFYENVTYRGPQMIYHSYGRVRITDSTITITATGSTESQELAEVNRLELDGTVAVNHQSTSASRAVAWFTGDDGTRGLEILPGADVRITSTNNYFLFAQTSLGAQRATPFHIGAGASLLLDMNRGISYNSTHYVPTVTVDAGGFFHLIQRTAVANTASLYVTQAFRVAQGGSVLFETTAPGASPLVHFPNANFALELNDPKSVVFYNSAGNALSFGAAGSFNMTAGQANRWTAAGTGGLDDIPAQKWHRPSWNVFRLQGTQTAALTTVTSNDFTAAELVGLPNLSLLQMQTARVLSFGNLPLTIGTLTDDGRPVTGQTEPLATVRVTYNSGGTVQLTGTAGADGSFSIPTPAAVPAGTTVTVEANTPFLITVKTADVVEAGELDLVSATTPIPFRAPPLSGLPDVLLPRVQTGASVVVTDTRAVGGQWVLMAQVNAPLQTAEGDVLENSVVFRDALGQITVLDATPRRVYLGGPNVVETTVSWPADQGILIRPTAPIRTGVEYSTVVHWTVEEITP